MYLCNDASAEKTEQRKHLADTILTRLVKTPSWYRLQVPFSLVDA